MSDYRDKRLGRPTEEGWLAGGSGADALPDILAENRAFGRLAGLAALALAVVGLVYCYLASPLADGLDAAELNRITAVKRFYDHPPAGLAQQPRIIGLGDSITIAGLDCYLLDKLAGPAGYRCYNLALPAKVHAEYLFDVQEPVVQGATIVTFVHPAATFSPHELALAERRSDMFSLAGYRLDRPALAEYSRLVPGSGVPYLLQPRWLHVLASRWRIVTSLETSLRLGLPWIGADTKRSLRYRREVYSHDLKYAAMPVDATADETHRSLLRRMRDNPTVFAGGFAPSQAAQASYRFALDRMAAAGNKVVVVIAPVHPLLRQVLGEAAQAKFRRQIESYASPNVRVLDFSTLLDESGFRDDVHPNAQGGEIITRALAQELQLTTPETGPGEAPSP